jgi:hypothetical protein
MERITKRQFAAACENATRAGRVCGALNDGETIGTAIAWTLSYVVVYNAAGAIVHQLSEPDNTRGLFNRIRAIQAAYEFAARNVPAYVREYRENGGQ